MGQLLDRGQLAAVRNLLVREIDSLAAWVQRERHYHDVKQDARLVRMLGALRGVVMQASEGEIDSNACHVAELLCQVGTLLDTKGTA